MVFNFSRSVFVLGSWSLTGFGVSSTGIWSQWLHWLLTPGPLGIPFMSHLECSRPWAPLWSLWNECFQAFIYSGKPDSACALPKWHIELVPICVSCPSSLELSFSLWNGIPFESLGLLPSRGTRVLRVTLVMYMELWEVICTCLVYTWKHDTCRLRWFSECLQRIPLRNKWASYDGPGFQTPLQLAHLHTGLSDWICFVLYKLNF